MLDHYTEVHSTKGYVICCGKKVVNYSQILIHMACHLQPSAFVCHICGEIRTTPQKVFDHLQMHEEEKPLSCFCVEPVTNETTKLCQKCGKKYTTYIIY